VSQYCDVVLPVPLDRAFTYELGELEAEVGARVMVPFGGQRLVGVVVGLHDVAPGDEVEVKRVQQVMDEAALLPDELMELGKWVAAYYCAPLGEVLRGMMPLTAEVRRQWTYRIGEPGRKVLYEGAARGSSRRSKLSVEDQNREYAVLNYLESGEAVKTTTIRSATGGNKALLDAMAKKKWLVREPLAEVRDARRVEMVAVLEEVQGIGEEGEEAGKRLPKLNENQLGVMAELAGCGGRELVRALRGRMVARGVPESTLGTLVKRGLVRLEETAQTFHVTGLQQEGKKFAHEHVLNEAQTEALGTIAAAMEKGGFRPHLLYGVTGSGKTAVYVAAMQRALAAGKSALLLVPEIGLTPGTAAQMVAAFGGEVALLHSQLTPDERAEQWHRIRRGEARVVIGTRSAVFAPMPDLGLILVDEEHDGSYKQEETPRYHGRDVAVMRAKLVGCTVVLGSATPSLESWQNAERGRYVRVEILERVESRPLPKVEMVDMREEFRETGQEQLFSRRLIEETQATIDRGEQVIILINRRGYSFVVMCRSCGEKLQCENCAISLTYHKPGNEHDLTYPGSGAARVGQRLECHYCGFRRGVPKACEKCGSEHLYYLGAGSQQGEERLQELFPGARIGRMDRDTVRSRGDMERLLERLQTGEINLLVGTQMIAKGHDFHGVTLVGVVGADFALGLPDFRAAERVFQLLTQVSGRAGRGELPGKVLVQTYQPDHYVNKFARDHDYRGFAGRELYFRRAMRYPPFSVLANVIVQSEKLEEVLDWTTRLGRWVQQRQLEGVRALGPAAAPNSRLKRIYRYHLVLKADRRDVLASALREMLVAVDREEIPRRAVIVDVDPMHLM
jgi:primosomal protein N' (replication factor Y)